MSVNYRLQSADRTLDARLRDRLFRDLAGDDQSLYIQARVRSGDYFVTLATELETLQACLSADHVSEADYLGRLVEELHHLQQHYQLQERT